MASARARLFRKRGEGGHQPVTFIELFFDLVFVFAITQLSHGLLDHLTPLGLAQTLLLAFAVWWAWIYTSWVTNWLDPDHPLVRLVLLALMLIGLGMSTSLPRAFGDGGMAFALSYVALQLGRSLFMLWALRSVNPANHRNFIRITLWLSLSGLLWIGGAAMDGGARMALWIAAAALEFIGPAMAFRVPGLGRSSTADWNVAGGHMAERCALFIIIALGEAIVVTGATFSTLAKDAATTAAFLASFSGSAVMWWIYFDSGVHRGSDRIAHSDDPGRIARIAYTYFHLPIVLGILIVAVADELVLSHPLGHVSPSLAWTAIGGPAVFLCGTMLFKQVIANRRLPLPPLSHLVGLALLGGIALVHGSFSPVALSIATTGALVVVALWEYRALRTPA